jgi:hypothetical protein
MFAVAAVTLIITFVGVAIAFAAYRISQAQRPSGPRVSLHVSEPHSNAAWVVEQDPRSLPPPPLVSPSVGDCKSWKDWSSDATAYEFFTEVDVDVTAREDTSVVIQRVTANILSQKSSNHWYVVRCAGEGGPEPLAHFNLDLAADPPSAVWMEVTGDEEVPVADYRVHIGPGSSDSFRLSGSTSAAHVVYDWELSIDLLVNGQARTMTIDNEGQPFRTAASVQIAPFFASTGDEWKVCPETYSVELCIE